MYKKIICSLFLFIFPLVLYSQTRIEVKQWYMDDGTNDIKEIKHYDKNADGTITIKKLENKTLEVISEKKEIPYKINYKYENIFDTNNRMIKETAYKNDSIVYVTDITYSEKCNEN